VLDIPSAFSESCAILDPTQLVHEEPKGHYGAKYANRNEKLAIVPAELSQEEEYPCAGGDGKQRQKLCAKVRDRGVGLARLLIDDSD
jgi:hypothetical protein